jgi:hypothetical protein
MTSPTMHCIGRGARRHGPGAARAGAGQIRAPWCAGAEVTLLDLVDRAIDHGVILAGDITNAVADIDLIYVGLQVLLTSVERVEEFRVERERAVGREVREEDRHEY